MFELQHIKAAVQPLLRPLVEIASAVTQLGRSFLRHISPYHGNSPIKTNPTYQPMKSMTNTEVKLTTIEPVSKTIDRLLDQHSDISLRLANTEAQTQADIEAMMDKGDLSPSDLDKLENYLDQSKHAEATKTSIEQELVRVFDKIHGSPAFVRPAPAATQLLDKSGAQPRCAPERQTRSATARHAAQHHAQNTVDNNSSTAAESHSLHLSTLPKNTSPKKLRAFLKSKGYENHNVSGQNLNCGLRTLLICLSSHFGKTPANTRPEAISKLVAHLKPGHQEHATVLRDFLSLGQHGIKSVRQMGDRRLLLGAIPEAALLEALNALATDLKSSGKLSETCSNDINRTHHSALHMLSNDSISELLQSLSIPAHVVSFSDSIVQLESMTEGEQSKIPSESNSRLEALNDQKPCIYLSGFHFQILVPS